MTVDVIVAFSILERIEWAATGVPNTERENQSSFQYPRTDRMGCDLRLAQEMEKQLQAFSILERIEWAATVRASACRSARHDLSVSSNGSNGLRRTRSITRREATETFSILERIEWAATRRLVELQHQVALFQYPRTDRMGCDACTSMIRAQCVRLSVSSNGSNGLRLEW